MDLWALAAVSAFNLVCSGTSWSRDLVKDALFTKRDETPIVDTLRVDLQQGRWCMGDCTKTEPIYRVEATRILLEYNKNDELALERGIVVDRETGNYLNRNQMGDFVIIRTGECNAAPFTGFPKLRF
jgi:hypothetical protein